MSVLHLFGTWGAGRLNGAIQCRKLGPLMEENTKRELESARSFNLCAGKLAKTMGLASMMWDRAEQLKEAA